MPEKSCFFIGHADAPSSVLPSLLEAIERHITCHCVREFFFGNHGNFDRLALHALTTMKKQHPHIRLIFVTPYHPALHPAQKPEHADEIFYPFDQPVMPRYAIVRANQTMIRKCDYLIAYVHHPGKARNFLEYAQKQAIRIENIPA